MKCPKCGSEQFIDYHFLRGGKRAEYFACDACAWVFTEWQQERIAALEGALRELIIKRSENLRQTCPDCDDQCTHGIQYDPILEIARKALEGK